MKIMAKCVVSIIITAIMILGGSIFLMADSYANDGLTNNLTHLVMDNTTDCCNPEEGKVPYEEAEQARIFPCCGCWCWDGFCCIGFGCCIPTVWPMPNRQGLGRNNITSPFGWRNWSGGSWHNGVDVAAFNGERINAMARGAVTFSGWDRFGGNMVNILHPNGVRSVYMHFSRVDVFTNNPISFAGQQIGGAGATGEGVSGVHLHFEIRNASGTRLNPLQIWHWDDHRYPGVNPNPLFWFTHGSFNVNTHFNPNWWIGRSLDLEHETTMDCISLRCETFYQIDRFFIDLVPYEEWVLFRDTVLSSEVETGIMPLVAFVQYFDITRKMMEYAIMQIEASRLSTIEYLMSNQDIVRYSSSYCVLLCFMKSDFSNIPNLDIIFTFNNTIIEMYYLR